MAASRSLLVRLAVLSSRGFHRVVGMLQGLHAGIWLGLLDDDQLDAATAAFYAREPKYLDHAYNTGGLQDWESDRITAAAPPPARILVAGAGGGREVLALAEQGYTVVGYDPSSDLVDHANDVLADSGDARIVRSEGPSVPPEIEGPFDVVLFGWGAICHIPGSHRRIGVLHNIAERVSPEGAIVVSFLRRRPAVKPYIVAATTATLLRRLRGIPAVELGDWLDGSFDHHHTFDELDEELTAAGFTVTERHPAPIPHVVARRTVALDSR